MGFSVGHYILTDLNLSFFSCGILSVMDHLGFQRPPEAFPRGIIITVTLAPHRRLHIKLFKYSCKGMGAILAPAIRRKDQRLAVNQKWSYAAMPVRNFYYKLFMSLQIPYAGH
jgi:hypothetical protein